MTLLSTENELHSALLTIVNGLIIAETGAFPSVNRSQQQCCWGLSNVEAFIMCHCGFVQLCAFFLISEWWGWPFFVTAWCWKSSGKLPSRASCHMADLSYSHFEPWYSFQFCLVFNFYFYFQYVWIKIMGVWRDELWSLCNEIVHRHCC